MGLEMMGGPMQLRSRDGVPRLDVGTAGGEAPDTLAEEAIEWEEAPELALQSSPARGIFHALVIGAGVWTLIFAAIALARAILSG